jgi:hypothetical protein
VCIGGIRSSIRATRAMHVAPLLGKCVGWRCVRRGYLPATPSWGPPPAALLNDTPSVLLKVSLKKRASSQTRFPGDTFNGTEGVLLSAAAGRCNQSSLRSCCSLF